jgi:hypothetical protein
MLYVYSGELRTSLAGVLCNRPQPLGLEHKTVQYTYPGRQGEWAGTVTCYPHSTCTCICWTAACLISRVEWNGMLCCCVYEAKERCCGCNVLYQLRTVPSKGNTEYFRMIVDRYSGWSTGSTLYRQNRVGYGEGMTTRGTTVPVSIALFSQGPGDAA